MGAYHLARKSGNFGLNSNGKVIFRKLRSEIVDYLQKYSSFSVRNGTTEISLPFAKLSSFQSLISRKQLQEIELKMVSAVSFSWFTDFAKTLTIIQRSSQSVYSDKWQASPGSSRWNFFGKKVIRLPVAPESGYLSTRNMAAQLPVVLDV